MTLQTHIDTLRARGHVLVDGHVKPNQAAEIRVEADAFGHLPAGTLIFYSLVTFDEDDFQYDLPDERSHLERLRDPLETEIVDLRDINPGLKGFEKHLGRDAMLMLAAPYQGAVVTADLSEAWYDEFSDRRDQAQGQALLEAQARREAAASAQAAALEVYAQRLRLLQHDEPFLKQARSKSTTLRSLLTYAQMKEPAAVAALGEGRTKELVQQLRDQLKFQD